MENLLKAVRLSIIVLFAIVNIFLLILNWKMFTTSQLINLGFGQITAAPAILELVVSFIFIFLLWLTIGNAGSLRYEISKCKQQIEILEQENKTIGNAIESLEGQIEEYEKQHTPSSKKTVDYPRMTMLQTKPPLIS